MDPGDKLNNLRERAPGKVIVERPSLPRGVVPHLEA